MEHKLTDEQLAVITAATDTKDNILVSALAGAAKSTTLERVTHALPGVNMLYLAFNKRIADDMKPRLPLNAKAQTLNSLGHQSWAQTVGHRLTLDFRKAFNILSTIIGELPSDDQRIAWKSSSFLLKSFREGKAAGYVPDSFETTRPNKRLMSDEEYFMSLPEEPNDLEADILVRMA